MSEYKNIQTDEAPASVCKRIVRRKIYIYRKGEVRHLDDIYPVQGLDGGDWWDHCESERRFPGDMIIITRDIKISIEVTTVESA